MLAVPFAAFTVLSLCNGHFVLAAVLGVFVVGEVAFR